METTYLIDTNILVYAYNEDVAFHEEALRILENALKKNCCGMASYELRD